MKKIALRSYGAVAMLTILTTTALAMNSSDLPPRFTDVPETHKNYDAINYLYDNGIVSGYENKTFKPEASINRAELLKILGGIEVGGLTGSEYNNCFSDVKADWYAPYVCFGKTAKWISGYPDGSFKPAQTVNKVEALKILLNSQNVDVSGVAFKAVFEDVTEKDWFFPYVLKAKEMGVLTETSGKFMPASLLTRAEASQYMYKILMHVKAQNEPKDPTKPDETTPPKDTTTANPKDYTAEQIEFAQIDSIQLITLESFPVQMKLVVKGNMKNGCGSLFTPTATMSGNKVIVEVKAGYKGEVCTQALVPFEKTVVLPVQGLKAGTYEVNVNNGAKTTNFTFEYENSFTI